MYLVNSNANDGRAKAACQTISVPLTLALLIDQLCEQIATRNGETKEEVRRAVEIAILRRGIEEIRVDLLTGNGQ